MVTLDWRNARVESKIVWDYLVATFNPDVIVPFVYSGVSAAHELLTYDAKKIYFGLSLSVSGYTVTTAGNLYLYNAANAKKSAHTNLVMAWDATAAAMKYSPANIILP